jgi:replicative DNA helicase
VVDYIQRMPMPSKVQRYDQAIGDVCNRLVDLAAAEGIAVVVGSQLNRNSETRDKDSRRPQLSDLRDSGRLEELAKVVIAVHRPAKYDASAPADLLELCILKNHQGPADVVVPVRWDMETHSITDHHDTRRR